MISLSGSLSFFCYVELSFSTAARPRAKWSSKFWYKPQLGGTYTDLQLPLATGQKSSAAYVSALKKLVAFSQSQFEQEAGPLNTLLPADDGQGHIAQS